MGNKFEVWAYVLSDEGYEYQQTWRGESAIGALRAARRAKRSGAGCVKVEWR